jgi:hypothetical protein
LLSECEGKLREKWVLYLLNSSDDFLVWKDQTRVEEDEVDEMVFNTFPRTIGLTVICMEGEYARVVKVVEGNDEDTGKKKEAESEDEEEDGKEAVEE